MKQIRFPKLPKLEVIPKATVHRRHAINAILTKILNKHVKEIKKLPFQKYISEILKRQ